MQGLHLTADLYQCRCDAAWLTEAGIECMQGYYFGAPTATPPWQMAKVRMRA